MLKKGDQLKIKDREYYERKRQLNEMLIPLPLRKKRIHDERTNEMTIPSLLSKEREVTELAKSYGMEDVNALKFMLYCVNWGFYYECKEKGYNLSRTYLSRYYDAFLKMDDCLSFKYGPDHKPVSEYNFYDLWGAMGEYETAELNREREREPVRKPVNYIMTDADGFSVQFC